jgi:hypothetical protein
MRLIDNHIYNIHTFINENQLLQRSGKMAIWVIRINFNENHLVRLEKI